VHPAAHVFHPYDLSPHASAQLNMVEPTHVFMVPGLRRPTFISVLDGFSLSYAVMFAMIGAAGLAVLAHAWQHELLLRWVARVFARSRPAAAVGLM
jgi:hypothetical protein